MSDRPIRPLAAAVTLLLATTAALAQDGSQLSPTGLPGGATSLTETHRDWMVTCEARDEGQAIVRDCAMSQQRSNEQGLRTLAIELTPAGEGVTGIMILPFGLDVTQGVTLRVDEGEPSTSLAFSTCLPLGCLVPLDFESAWLEALTGGATLTVTAQTVNGGEAELGLSLAGFASALNRTRQLLS